MDIQGLSPHQVIAARKLHGNNSLDLKKQNNFLNVLKHLLKEPMVILLLFASAIYFINGSVGDAIFLSIAILLISIISFYQNRRRTIALAQLKKLTQPDCKVIRNGQTIQVKSEELVVGDSVVVEEGAFIAADGVIVQSDNFSVNESILTGESLPVLRILCWQIIIYTQALLYLVGWLYLQVQQSEIKQS